MLFDKPCSAKKSPNKCPAYQNFLNCTGEFDFKYQFDRNAKPTLSPICMGPPLEDVICYAIYCHQKLLLYVHPAGKCLPFVNSYRTETIEKQALNGLSTIFCKNTAAGINLKLLQLYRIHDPVNRRILQKHIFCAKSVKCLCANGTSKKQQWTPLSCLDSGTVENLFTSEPVIMGRLVERNSPTETFVKIYEYSTTDFDKFFPQTHVAYEKITAPADLKNIKESFYFEFLQHCWPFFDMTIDSFILFMQAFGFNKKDPRLPRLFFAANKSGSNVLFFEELVHAFIAMESICAPDDERIEFMFRYYDTMGKGFLNSDDLNKFLKDLHSSALSEQSKSKKSDNSTSSHSKGGALLQETLKKTSQIKKDQFVTILKANKDIVTSCLLRSKSPILAQFIRSSNHRQDRFKERDFVKKSLVPTAYRGTPSCEDDPKKMYLSTHIVSFRQNGIISQFKSLQKKEAVNPIYDPKSFLHNLVKMLRDFNKEKGDMNSPNGFLSASSPRLELVWKKIVKLAVPLLIKDGPCPNVEGPAYVVGDIHGNIEDLLSIEAALWKRIPLIGPKLVFMGDYVDRGKWGVECALYLITLKILHPEHVMLLRGNHEVRQIQERYTFKFECTSKYGEENGVKIWDHINDIFDYMPISCTIDNVIFCCHGGLTPAATDLAPIRAIPMPVKKIDELLYAYDLVWSDPVNHDTFLDRMETVKNTCNLWEKGYIASPRGAGYYFNQVSTIDFLSATKLQHILRAHFMIVEGVKHQHSKRCTTVFSCSHYLGQDNLAAIVFVDINGRMRRLRIATEKNLPAMDKPDEAENANVS